MDGVCVSDFEEDSKLSCGEGAMCFPGLGFEDNITLVTEDFFVNTVYDFSICFWFKTSNTDKHSLFSWATEFSQNTILFFHPKDFRVEFDKDKFPSSGKDRLNFADNLWHHTCVTYASDTGSIKMYVDNEIYAEDEDFMTGYSIENDGSITLGQEQDCVGGCFNDDDAFIGYMREVYVFNDHILDADEVASLYECDLTGVTGKPGISYEENVCSEVSDGLTGNIVNVYLDEAGWEESHG